MISMFPHFSAIYSFNSWHIILPIKLTLSYLVAILNIIFVYCIHISSSILIYIKVNVISIDLLYYVLFPWKYILKRKFYTEVF